MEVTTRANDSIICMTQKAARSRGIFFGDNPFLFATPTLLAQLSLCALLTTTLQYFLNPLGESSFISQILAGVLLGPSVIGNYRLFREEVFPVKSFYICDTFAYFGVMLYLFIVGVKTDLNILRKTGRKALLIGVSTFLVPLVFNSFLAFFLSRHVPMEDTLRKTLIWIASFQSLSSFHVILCLISDLKLLNSELGKLAISSSMISGTCSLLWTIVIFTGKQSTKGENQSFLPIMLLCVAGLMTFIILVLRPLMFWIIRRSSHETTIKEGHIFLIFIMILGSSLFGEAIGQHFLFGPIILGMAVPAGPPLGSALVDKLDCFVSTILLPIYFVVSGARIDFALIKFKHFGIVELLAFFAVLCKVIGAMLPSIFCRMPAIDAFYLGLILSTQGIIDVICLGRAQHLKLIDQESYSIMVLSTFLFTGIISPVVKTLYKPTFRYLPNKRRTIQHANPTAGLRILACIHHQENTPSIVNLLAASNPTSKSPIWFYVVHLVDLAGRTAPILFAHHAGRKNSIGSNESDHIVNAFRLYENQNEGSVVVYPFTAVSPHATMHNDVCGLALEKRVSIVIVPFHKLWTTIHGDKDSSENAVRGVNLDILEKAPSSVGILVDRGTLNMSNPMLASTGLCSVAVIFLGGQHDREALAYANRMAKHPNVGLTLIHFKVAGIKQRLSNDIELDFDMINDIRAENLKNERFLYQEVTVEDSVGLTSAIRKVENIYDLILVGRSHANDSPLLVGLAEWNEYPELGCIGDMLVSSASSCKVSVLVVQQQYFAGQESQEKPKNLSPKYLVEESASVVDMPRKSPLKSSAKVVPNSQVEYD